MASAIKLLVGLGNPGKRYQQTRHNAGFHFLDTVLSDLDTTLKTDLKSASLFGKGCSSGQSLWVIAPQGYMNESGRSVAYVARFYKIQPQHILVVHDELDLLPGSVRVKQGGGHGGHNGLRDIIEKLGSRDFVRLRIGIGHPGHASEVTNYVLKNAPAEERNRTDEAISRARHELSAMLAGDFDPVMNRLHTEN